MNTGGKLLALLVWGVALPGLAADERALPAPGSEAWRLVSFPRVEKQTRYTVVQIDGAPAVHASSDCAAAALVLPLDGVDLRATPLLGWRWRVAREPAAADPRSRSGDDFAARVYVMFRFESERASLWQRMRRRVAESVHGAELPGNALDYVWSRGEARGSQWDNPYAAETKMVSLGAGELGEWAAERVDVLAEHRSRFGGEAPEAMALGLMTDSDDTCSSAEAWYADFHFRSR